MKRYHSLVRGLVAGAIVGVVGAALALSPVGLDFEKNVGLTWLFGIRGAVTPPPDVAIVAIDGETGRALDLPRLPRDWPRTTHAGVIERIVQSGASVLVIDMDFSRAKSADEDLALAQAVDAAGRVVLYEMLSGRRQRIEGADGSTVGWTWVEERRPPSPTLAAAAKALGAFPLPKLDDAANQFWAFKESGAEAPTTAALALQLHAHKAFDQWQRALADSGAPELAALPDPALIDGDPERVAGVMRTWREGFRQDPDLRQRVDALLNRRQHGSIEQHSLVSALARMYGGPNAYFLNFYGPPGTIPTLPYAAFSGVNGADPAAYDLNGKVVFLGYSDVLDPEQPDAFYTVFRSDDGVDLSGVEIMATGFANLLTGTAIRPLSERLSASTVMAIGLVVGLIGATLPAVIATGLVVVLAAAYAVAAQGVFNEAELWLPLATPILIQVPLALLLGLMSQYLIGKTRERRLGEAISRYVPENIRRDLTEGHVNPASVDKVVYGTCFATDMAGFTTISESKTPKELADFMNAYFDTLAQSLKRHRVDVTEFHADTIMCAWTAEQSDPSARRNAVHAAIDLAEEIRAFGRERELPHLHPRIGLQDGWFYLGHTGGGGRMSFSILGDPANTAARLEGLNKVVRTSAVAARSVVEGVDDILVRPIGSFVLAGKGEAIPVVELVARRDAATGEQRELCERFAAAMEGMRRGDLGATAKGLEELLADFAGDGPAQFYQQRLQRFIAEDITGEDPTVVRLESK